MIWLLLAAGSAIAWAIVQTIDKALISSEAPSPSHYLVVSGTAAVVPVVGIYIVNVGSLRLPSLFLLILGLLSGVCYFVSNAFFFSALSDIDATVSSAALSLIPGATAIGSFLVLGQSLSVLAISGIIAISVGVYVISSGKRPDGSKIKVGGKTWAALFAANSLLVAEYLLEGRLVENVKPVEVFLLTRIGVLLSTLVLFAVRPTLVREALHWAFARSRGVGLLSIGNEGLDMLAVALLIAAYAHGPVGLATSVAYTQAAFVFVLTIAANFVKPGIVPTEGDNPGHAWRRIVGLVVVVSGVIFVGL